MNTLTVFGAYIALTGTGILLWELIQPRHKLPHKIMERIFKRCNVCVREGDQIYYPILVNKEKTESGWLLIYSPPVGMSAKAFHDNLPAFQQALGEVEIESGRGFICVAVNQRPLKEKIAGETWLEQSGADH